MEKAGRNPEGELIPGRLIKNFKAPQKMRFRFFGGKTDKYPAEYIETENIADLHEIFDYLLERHTWISLWERTDKK